MTRHSVLTIVIALCVQAWFGAMSSGQALQPAPATPSGWKKSIDGSKQATAFTKTGLGNDETLAVKFYPRKVLETNQTLEQWLVFRLATGRAPKSGKWVGAPTVIRQTGNMIEGSREYLVEGQTHSIRGLAVGVDNMHVRFGAILASDTAGAKKAKRESEKLLYQLFKVENEAAIKDSRGVNIELNPPKVKNLKAGGAIKPGRYVGNAVYLKDKKAGQVYDLVMHANGEYEFLKGGKKREPTGKYVYSNATGRLNIMDGLENSTYDHEDDYCVYGKESTGKTIIYAREGSWQRKLVWVSESDRPAPSVLKREKEIALAEAKRYKHVTEPGKGVRSDEIEAVMYAWESSFYSGAYQLDHWAYLIMKDGRVLDGLPTAPDTLDAAVSRSREPDRWGWWKKEEGNYTFAWPVRPREYRQPKGTQIVGFPFEKGARLEGDFGAASTTVNLITDFSSVRWWGIKFSKNGRFMKYRRGSMGGGGVLGMEAVSMTVWDDEGAVSTTLSPSITTMSKTKKAGTGAGRMGKYEFDGYRLTLTFDDGHVEHHATFTNKETKTVWFEGTDLSVRTKK